MIFLNTALRKSNKSKYWIDIVIEQYLKRNPYAFIENKLDLYRNLAIKGESKYKNAVSIFDANAAYQTGKIFDLKGNNDLVWTGGGATRINKDKLIENVSFNVPKIDHTTGKPAILIEPTRTNKLEYSNDFSHNDWVKRDGVIITPDYEISPDGSQNASLLTSTQDSGDLYYNLSSTTRDYAISIWIKSLTGNKEIQLRPVAGADIFENKLVTSEWQRIWVQSINYSGIYLRDIPIGEYLIYEAQVEEGIGITSNIPTNGTVTRTMSMPATQQTDMLKFNQAAFYLHIDFTMWINQESAGLYLLEFSHGGDMYKQYFNFNGLGNNFRFQWQNGSSAIYDIALGNILTLPKGKVVVTFNETTVKTFFNGVFIGSFEIPEPVLFDNIRFQDTLGAGGSRRGQAAIYEMITFNKYMSNEEAINLTTL